MKIQGYKSESADGSFTTVHDITLSKIFSLRVVVNAYTSTVDGQVVDLSSFPAQPTAILKYSVNIHLPLGDLVKNAVNAGIAEIQKNQRLQPFVGTVISTGVPYVDISTTGVANVAPEPEIKSE